VCGWGLGRLGGLAVLLNTELTGGFLRHQLESRGATLAVLDRARWMTTSCDHGVEKVASAFRQLRDPALP
jgi:hypothetical protein